MDRVWELTPHLVPAWAALKDAVNRQMSLPIELLEVVRYRMALLNHCALCMAGRDPRAVRRGFTDETYAAVGRWRDADTFDARQRLALEYTERFALEPEGIDDELFERLHAEFDDAELLELTFYVGRYLAFGRLAHVLGLDDACELAPT